MRKAVKKRMLLYLAGTGIAWKDSDYRLDFEKGQKILTSYYYARKVPDSIIDIILSSIGGPENLLLDVFIYNKLKDKTEGKLMWLRNNISTIVCNCAENFAFIFLAYVGIFDGATIISIALSTSVIEFLVALMDTPFLYIAKKITRDDG